MKGLKECFLAVCIAVLSVTAHAQTAPEEVLNEVFKRENPGEAIFRMPDFWIDLPDDVFAELIAQPMAYGVLESPENMARVAWMYFARLVKSAPAGSNQTMDWLTWHTNNETFSPPSPPSSEAAQQRNHVAVSKAKRALEASVLLSGSAPDTTCPKNFPPQAVTRNDISFAYLNQDLQIFSIDALAHYLNASADNRLDVPIGGIGAKGVFIDESCIKALDGTKGAGGITLDYETQAVWDNVQVSQTETYRLPMTGLHVMAKLQPAPVDVFTSNTPSWFWATFELKTNPGIDNVVAMLTEPDPLGADEVAWIQSYLTTIGDCKLKNYVLTGTQRSFSLPGGGASILGNSKLENFAGGGITQFPQFKTPETWTSFDASCHACHSTAAFDPKSKQFFAESATNLNKAFPLVVGNLPPSIMARLTGTGAGAGGYDYQSLDFLWPITFQFLNQE